MCFAGSTGLIANGGNYDWVALDELPCSVTKGRKESQRLKETAEVGLELGLLFHKTSLKSCAATE